MSHLSPAHEWERGGWSEGNGPFSPISPCFRAVCCPLGTPATMEATGAIHQEVIQSQPRSPTSLPQLLLPALFQRGKYLHPKRIKKE